MKNWKPILGIVLTFLLGIVTGGLIVAGIAKNRIEHFIRNGAADVVPLVVHRLGNKLDLTSEQKGKLTSIVSTGQARLREIRLRVEPEIKTSLWSTVEEIRSILTEEQKPQFEKIVENGEKHFGTLKK